VARVTGDQQLSDQKIWQIVNHKTVEISHAWQIEVEQPLGNKALSFPKIQDKIDIYDSESREVIVFEDAIQVRGQKENRVRKQKDNEERPAQPVAKEKAPSVFTKVVMLQKKNQEFEYMAVPVDETGQAIGSLPDVLNSRVIKEYGSEARPVPVIAITDGAQVIRQHLHSVFGVVLIIILDWYHLGKKVRELMSMIARNNDEKNLHLKFIFYHLWRGEVDTVIDYLKTKVPPRNEEKHREPINYINQWC
jgi:hypothetical protein